MAPIPAGRDRALSLEAGLLGTLEEEKAALIQDPSKGHTQQTPPSRKMPAIRRLAVAIILGLFVGLGLSLAKDIRPCRGAAHRVQDHAAEAAHAQGNGVASTIAELVKRQGGGGSNATSAASAPTTTSTESSTSASSTPSDSSTSTPTTTPSAPETSSASVPSASPSAPTSSSQDTATTGQETTSAGSNPTTSSEAPANSASSTSQQASSGSSPSTSAPSTTEKSSAASSDEATATSDETSRKTITTGAVSTSSAVRKTWTTTMGDGGVKVLTSTSWVAVVPSAASSASGNSKEADLQNAASQNQGVISFAVAAGALVAGLALV